MKRLKILFSDYLKGKSKRIEKKIIDLWYEEKEKSSSKEVSDKEAEAFSNRAWAFFLMSVNEDKKKKSLFLSLWIGYGGASVAAIGLLLIVFNLSIFKNAVHNEKPSIMAEKIISSQFTTQHNMKRVTLADGSVVHLNMETTLSLHKGMFNAHTREVWLDKGEAFFEVTKDPHRPFIVHTADNLRTRVLGTSFNIKAYRALGKQVVSVKTGRVQVSKNSGEKVLLNPDNKASFDNNTGSLTAGITDGAAAADWRTGRIVLNDAPLNEVALRLNQYYNVKLINEAQISAQTKVYFEFTVAMPLKHIARALSDIYDTKHKIENNQIILFKN